jgi:hypothetical protein
VLGDKLQNCQRRDPLPAEVRCPAVLRFVRFFPEGP